jgi:hypothetical protein
VESPGGYCRQDALSYLSEVEFRPHGAATDMKSEVRSPKSEVHAQA